MLLRPRTVMELIDAFACARDDSSVGVIILTGAGERHFVQAETKKYADMADM